uniref:DEF6 guanine nucleotide exchange factor a n=1 Tax=Lepisosteus oculatus TaxID=7918 RepID=W5N0X0_LEPOC
MELRGELLKSIWYAFTALDVEKSGKVSKSQLKVLSHNLCTVLSIPHDPVALEEHFRDDDDGPVSSQGYMPYLNKYILDKVEEGAFVKENFDELCWTLTAKKNYRPEKNGKSVLSMHDAFRLWCLFNFLSEDRYPLVMVPDEVEYLLKKVCVAMSMELNCVELEDYISQEAVQQSGITVWHFLDLVNSGKITRGIDKQTISMAIEEVYREIVGDVLKEGYLWKRGQLRRNWTERWFTLRPNSLAYFVSEDRKERKGSISLDRNCCVEVLPDKDGKRCMFCVKTPAKTYEMSASDTKQRQEWTTGEKTHIIHTNASQPKCLHIHALCVHEGLTREQGRREAKSNEVQQIHRFHYKSRTETSDAQFLFTSQRHAGQVLLIYGFVKISPFVCEWSEAVRGTTRCAVSQARASMQAEMALKEAEADRQRKRIRELEEMQQRLEEALHLEIKARQDEEAFRYAQARLLAEEEEKLKALMALKEEQEEYILKTQREKQELKQEMESKSRSLDEAQRQLEEVRANRHRVDQDVVAAQRKLRQASTNVKHWNVQMNRLMHPIGPGEKRPSGSFSSFRVPMQKDPGLKLQLRQRSEEKDEESKENVNRGEGAKRLSQASDSDMDTV